MASEIRRIAPVRAGNIVAVLYALMMAAMTLIMFPIFSLVPMPEPQPGQPDPASAFRMMRWLLLLYPLFGLISGWFFGCLGAVVYNFVQRWTGGLLLEIEPQERGA